MSCAACVSRVEHSVLAVPGVESCEVNLLLGSMTVGGDADETSVIGAVSAAGYGASPEGKAQAVATAAAEKSEVRRMIERLVPSAVILLLLMYVTMGHIMWGAPMPSFFDGNYIGLALLELVLCIPILIINGHFFTSGVRGALHLSPNMDTLVALGVSASLLYSVAKTFAMTVPGLSDHALHATLHNLYYESAAMLPVLIGVGKLLEALAKGKTTSSIRALMDLAPKTALVERDGEQVTVSASEICVGDIIIVKRGETVPTDAEIISGELSADESCLTGESMPKDKSVGDTVYGGTSVLSGYARIRATKAAEDTVLAGIIRMVKEASGSKAPIAKTADRVAGVFVPAVLIISLITAVIWLIVARDFSYALARAVTVLVISCPCALGLATPVAIMVGSGVGARHGILYKTASALELCGRVRTVAFDKTGTVTEGTPKVTDVVFLGDDRKEYLTPIAAAESRSEHPIASAVLAYAEESGIDYSNVGIDEFHQENGGIAVRVGDKRLLFGNKSFVETRSGARLEGELDVKYGLLSSEGKTVLVLSDDERAVGLVALFDEPHKDSAEAISVLHSMGVSTVMITGDSEAAARNIADRVGIDKVIAEVLPVDKARLIKELSRSGRVAMVGDGVNDSVALTEADVGIAVGCGTDIAMDSADVVLTGRGISGVASALRLGRRTLRGIYENLFWAFCYNIIGIPLAAGAFTGWLGWDISPMFGAAAMSLSSFIVVTNALRINLFRPGGTRPSACATRAENDKQNERKNDMKTVTVKIEGMMCPHCSGRVKALLEERAEVSFADVSHERGNAIITLCDDVDISVLEEIVTGAGYKVVS